MSTTVVCANPTQENKEMIRVKKNVLIMEHLVYEIMIRIALIMSIPVHLPADESDE
jgi:hypothetical protein